MNLRLSLASFAFALCSIGSLAMAQQLPPDHYLVGTQGWVNGKPSDKLNTIQVISPYTGKATMLNVTGLPNGEAPANFIILSSGKFLVGTKSLNKVKASGNIYTLTLQPSNQLWQAAPLNTSPLGINVSDMVLAGQDLFVIGSSVFGNSGTDAKILRVSLLTGRVLVHLLLGDTYKKIKPRGALGLGSALVLVGKNLHAFTFDTTSKTAKQNEHWVVSTTSPVVATRMPSIPVSRRRVTNKVPFGFGTSEAFIDPENPKQLVVVGRWGELHWLNQKGVSVRHKGFLGTIASGPNLGELWRGAAINTTTHAIGLGDHNLASIDERRLANNPRAAEPFANDIARAIDPIPAGTTPTEIFTIAGMVYIPGPSSYRPIGNGCPDGFNGIPMSYASGAPARGNASFGFSLRVRLQGFLPTHTAILLVSGKRKTPGLPLGKLAPGCLLYLDPNSLGIIAPVINSKTRDLVIGPFALPSTKNLTVYTQWAVLSRRANALGWILSDARALRL